jgi:hypothetical protein
MSISRKAKVDRGLMVSLRILQGLKLISLWSFPLSHLMINGLGFSFLFFSLDCLLLSSYPHAKELSTISTRRTMHGQFCLYWCMAALIWCMSLGLILGV